MLSARLVKYIAFAISGISWFVLTLFYCIDGAVGRTMGIQFLPMGDASLGILEFIYYSSLLVLISKLFEEVSKDFKPLPSIWRLFTIGILCLVGLTVLVFFNYAIKYKYFPNAVNYLNPLLYSLANGIIAVFLAWAMFTFRRFVLYQKSRRKVIAWNIFRGVSILALLLTAVPLSAMDIGLNRILPYIFPLVPALATIVLSINNEWATYLAFQDKLKVLGSFVLLLIFFVFFFFMKINLNDIFQYGTNENNNFLFDCLGTFILIYSIISALILFINIPTSSAFEIKSDVLASFNKVVLNLQSTTNDKDILESLMNGSLLTANAEWGWIHIRTDNGDWNCKHQKGKPPIEILPYIEDDNLRENVMRDRKHFLVKNTKKRSLLPFFNWGKDYSLICLPIHYDQNAYGTLIIAKEYADAFEEGVIQNLVNFAEQTAIGIENSKVVKNALRLERYREHLKIAQEVQDELLPKQLPQNENFELEIYNQNADEVGGDYYDFLQKDTLYKIAIGDISGKGITAAFYMAEFKGIFHTLASLSLSVKEFIVAANRALTSCLPKSLFMTLTYLELDTQNKKISFIRAGHCPTFYYDATNDQLKLIREGTLGLGIRSHEVFAKMVKNECNISYKNGDFLVLFTDGIIEAKNQEKQEFGCERLQTILYEHRHLSAKQLTEQVMQGLYQFVGGEPKHDDLTLLVMKFL